MNSSAKKQNRVLLVTLVVILTAAALLIAVTGGANRKAKESAPPVDTKIAEESPESKTVREKTPSADETNAPEKDVIKKPVSESAPSDDKKAAEEAENRPASAEVVEEAREAAVIDTGVMPTLTLPVDAPALKGYSGETPVFSYTMNDYRTHPGIDFLCEVGTPVCAAADGVICEVADDPMMGVCVGISHSGGAVTRYCGLSEESLGTVKQGDTIKRGQPVGSVGDTALIESAEENHLHFELRVNGYPENPADFMKVRYLSEMVED